MMKTKYSIHTPVLLNETIENLNIKSSGSYIDATAGFGGHSMEIAKRLTNGCLTCIDQDVNAIEHLAQLFKNNKCVTIVNDNFANIDQIIAKPVDGIIMDLGVSSLMFDDPKRGFSYKLEGPLDMRMNLSNILTASQIVNNYSRAQLINVFRKYADVNNPSRVVNSIIDYRQNKPIETTIELANIISGCFKGSWIRKHPAKVYFQALRIETNNELDVLKQCLEKAIKLLKPKGRLLVITFQSLEDRIVKQFFKKLTEVKDLYGKESPIVKLSVPQFKLITKKPINPSNEELLNNNRSHSAKLRIIEKI